MCVFAFCSMAEAAGVSEKVDIPYMKVADLKPGMIGTGKTVFKGTKIEEFKAEILGILKGAYPKKSIILARLSGGPLENRYHCRHEWKSSFYWWQDHRGSSDGWIFPKEPIAGLTPFEEMAPLAGMDLTMPESMDIVPPGVSSSSQNVESAFQSFEFISEDSAARFFRPGKSMMSVKIAVLPLPLVVSGAHPEGLIALWQRRWTRSSLCWRRQAVPRKPRGQKTVSWARLPNRRFSFLGGDEDISAMGTLTYISGNKIIAFGHPMLAMGHVDWPLVSGYVENGLCPPCLLHLNWAR